MDAPSSKKLCYNLLHYMNGFFVAKAALFFFFFTYTFPSSHFNWNQSMRPVDRRSEMVCIELTKGDSARGGFMVSFKYSPNNKTFCLDGMKTPRALLIHLIQPKNVKTEAPGIRYNNRSRCHFESVSITMQTGKSLK